MKQPIVNKNTRDDTVEGRDLQAIGVRIYEQKYSEILEAGKAAAASYERKLHSIVN